MTTSDALSPRPRRSADRAPSGVRSSRAPGRPRDPRCDKAILDAALHELATAGFTRLSMEAIAAGAGVGKATVYRRWPTKDALIVDALDTLADEVEAVETGSLRDDLVAWLNSLRQRNLQTLSGQIMPKLVAELTTHPDLFATYSERVLEPSHRWAADLLRRGVASGELAADVDVELVVDMFVGPVAYRQFMSGDHEVSGTRIVRIVDVVLSGILSRTPAPPLSDAANPPPAQEPPSEERAPNHPDAGGPAGPGGDARADGAVQYGADGVQPAAGYRPEGGGRDTDAG